MRIGDLCTIDADGYLRVVGRTSDIIIRGGKNISAPAVEAEVAEHPAIAVAAAVAMPDEVFGERVCLYAELRPDAALELADVVQFLTRAGVSREWFPERLVVLDTLPRASGRQDRQGRDSAAGREARSAPRPSALSESSPEDDPIHYLALVVGTLLTLTTGWSLSSTLDSRLERLLATLVVAIAQIVLTLLFAGLVLRSLSTATVLVVNVLVTGAAISIAARSGDLPGRVRGEWAAMRQLRVRPTSLRLRDTWAWVLGAVVVVETAYLALAAYVLPPATWDAMTYHLVAVASWIRGDRILITPLRLFANVDPMNGELTFLWVGSLTRSDLLVDAPPDRVRDPRAR